VRVNGLGLDFERLEKSLVVLGVSHCSVSVLNEQPVCHFGLHDYVLVEKLDLILEITSDHFP